MVKIELLDIDSKWRESFLSLNSFVHNDNVIKLKNQDFVYSGLNSNDFDFDKYDYYLEIIKYENLDPSIYIYRVRKHEHKFECVDCGEVKE